MNSPRQLGLRQQRGSWAAKVTRAKTIRLLGQEKISLIHEWDDQDFTGFRSCSSWCCEPAWWNRLTRETWRDHSFTGASVWAQKGLRDDTINGTVGRSISVWRIGNPQLTSAELPFEFTERPGDAS